MKILISRSRPARRQASRAARIGVEALECRELLAGGMNYYISATGNDANSGLSAADAWRTVSRVNLASFGPGDAIRFEGGSSFSGNLVIDARSSGAPSQPITVESYATPRGERAEIFAGNGTGILVYNTQYVSISNMNVKGSGPLVNSGDGIQLYNGQPGDTKLKSIGIDRVTTSGFGIAGIDVVGGSGKSGFDGVTVTYADSYNNRLAGMRTVGMWSDDSSAYCHENVYVGYSKFHDNAGISNGQQSGNGIFLYEVDRGTIEYCQAYRNGWNNKAPNGPVGIWAIYSRRITIQYNESYGNLSQGGDGGGFDLDGGVLDSVMQYNYSHDNYGAGFLVYQYKEARPSSNNTVRYNISENDGRAKGYSGITIGSESSMSNLQIYNNTVFVSPDRVVYGTPAVFGVIVAGGFSNVSVRNNLFITTGGLPLVRATLGQQNLDFRGNAYWSSGGAFNIRWGAVSSTSLDAWRAASGQEMLNGKPVGLDADPLVTNPGAGGTIGDPLRLGSLAAYRLKPGSPLLGAGLDLGALLGIDAGPRDFFGNPIPAGPGVDIGANEQPAVAQSITLSGFPASITAGVAGEVTVTAYDAYGNVAKGYRGTIRFTSSDPGAILPADYTFTATDSGTHTFAGVVLGTAGVQSIAATDIATTNLSATSSGIAVSPVPSTTDLSFSTAPRLLGTAATAGTPRVVATQGRYAYVASSAAPYNLQVFDVGGAGAPALLATVATNCNYPTSIVARGNYVYITSIYNGGLLIYDVSSPASPRIVSKTFVGWYPNSVKIVGDYAYIVAYTSESAYSKLSIYNVGNPAKPTLVGAAAVPVCSRSVTVEGRYAYVIGDGSTNFLIFDVANPSAPSLLGSLPSSKVGTMQKSISIQGRYAYVAFYDVKGSGFQVIDVSDPANPVVRGRIMTGTTPTSMQMGDNYIYLIGTSLQVIDVSNPTSLTVVGSLQKPGLASSLLGNKLYVVDAAGQSLSAISLGG